MKLWLMITPEALGAGRLQSVLDQKRDALAKQGVVYSQALGRKNHTRLYMAVTDPAHVDPLRASRGYGPAAAQARLAAAVAHELRAEDERTISTWSISSAGMRSRKNERSGFGPGTFSPLIRIWV